MPLPSRGGAAPSAHVLRATSGTIALIVAGVAALLLLVDALVRAGILEMLRLAPWVLLAVWGVYVLMYASHIAYDRSGATVQNYLRRTRIPWPRVTDIGLRWQVIFTLDSGDTVPAYGGPVAGRPGRAERRTAKEPARAVPAALRELSELRDAWQGAEDAIDSPAVERSWDLPALAAIGVIVVGAIAATLTTAG